MASPQLAALRRHPRQVAVDRPEGKQRVAGELHDLTAMVVDQPDQFAKAVVQQLGELLDTARPGCQPAAR